jgi:hypothetical protein
MVIRRAATTGDSGDGEMRTLSFILAFSFALAAPSLAGSEQGGLPGIGTFAYSGSPAATSVSGPIVAARF